MQRRILFIGFILLSLSAIINWGCSKLDTTDIGSDLLPAVDNVNTFADTLDINTTQGVFNDTTPVFNSGNFIIGKITGDAVFGTTQADAFMQLKPDFYPYYYGLSTDTINNSLDSRTGFDSVVLCLSYNGFWGDSTTPVTFTVKTVNGNNGIWDSLYKTKNITYEPATGTTIGSKTVDVRTLGNYFFYNGNHKDSANNQVRIKLDASFANALFAQDTSVAGANNGLRSDSLFKVFNNGLGVFATNGNGLAYFNLADTNTKLEVHYRRKTSGYIDTSYSSFKLVTSPLVTSAGVIKSGSSIANHIVRNRPAAVSSPAATDLYIQTQPGTFVNLKIPAFDTMHNRIIHRAELIIQEDGTAISNDFTVPEFLYVDLRDTSTAPQWKPLYYDLNPSSPYDPDTRIPGYPYYPATGPDPFYFGGYARSMTDVFGQPIKYYNINITRYVQQIVTKHTPNYTLRLYAPSLLYYPQMADPIYLSYNNTLAKGRVKIGSGNAASSHRMILRIIYSNL